MSSHPLTAPLRALLDDLEVDEGDELFEEASHALTELEHLLAASGTTRFCSRCTAPFIITPSEASFLGARGWAMPARCVPCRRRVRDARGRRSRSAA
jgi:hypothetical protein